MTNNARCGIIVSMKTKYFVDAAANRLEKIINVYGKKNSWTEGFKAAVVSEDGTVKQTFVNRKASNSLMAEAWAVLKGIEVARDIAIAASVVAPEIVIASDVIAGFDYPAHDGETYLQIAAKIATQAGMTVTFERVEGSENPADSLSRSVTIIEAAKAETGTLDDLIAKSGVFSTQKTKLRTLVKKHGIEKAWVIWNEIGAPDFKINGLTVGKGNKPGMLLERMAL